MGTVRILEETTKKPLTLIGECAGIAYDSDTSDPNKCYKRGLSCVKAGHGRVLEFCDAYFELDGYSTRVIREFMRHVGDGLTVIQRSTRYVNEDGFAYFIPPAIKNNPEALTAYEATIKEIEKCYNYLINDMNITKEDAANLLPLGINTRLAVKKNARCLSDMAGQRLCTRAYHEYRQLMKDIIAALSNYSEEWKTLCGLVMKCKCDVAGYCCEEFSCGRYPKKDSAIA